MTTKQIYQAYLKGQATFEEVEAAARATLAKHREDQERARRSQA